ncbi:transposase [Paracoccus sp. (in: a-proteobacteria)]|uniref:transposase n=1 Tax=Paracoccus sp. TaxID=267 RepID=UPI0035B3BD0D
MLDFHVRKLVADDGRLAQITLPLPEVWLELRKRAARLSQHLLATARQSTATKLLVTIPGIGAITAISYVAAVEHPDNFRNSCAVGAWLGMTTRDPLACPDNAASSGDRRIRSSNRGSGGLGSDLPGDEIGKACLVTQRNDHHPIAGRRRKACSAGG